MAMDERACGDQLPVLEQPDLVKSTPSNHLPAADGDRYNPAVVSSPVESSDRRKGTPPAEEDCIGGALASEGGMRQREPKGDDEPLDAGNDLDAEVELVHLVEEEVDNDENLISDNSGSDDEELVPYPSSYLHRDEEVTDLPATVTQLTSAHGGAVYIVGTAHFSTSSQDDVAKTIRAVQPDAVMIELCESRSNILHMDEEHILREAKNMNFEKMRFAIKQSGLLQGMMHILLLSMSAHLTKELGMAPGGEFRKAFSEAQLIDGCRIHLGDRPIQITLRRALSTLSFWQWTKLAWHMLSSKDTISKEDVERCKQKDLLQEMLREMTGEFPALSHVFVNERDHFLAHSLRLAALPVPHPLLGTVPPVVVAVVGIGHVDGIVQCWEKQADIHELLIVPNSSMVGGVVRWTFKAMVVGIVSWGCYKGYKLTTSIIF